VKDRWKIYFVRLKPEQSPTQALASHREADVVRNDRSRCRDNLLSGSITLTRVCPFDGHYRGMDFTFVSIQPGRVSGVIRRLHSEPVNECNGDVTPSIQNWTLQGKSGSDSPGNWFVQLERSCKGGLSACALAHRCSHPLPIHP